MPKKKMNVHVVLRTDGWVVRREGSSRATSVHKTQREAVEAARELARSQSTDLVIHSRGGRIRYRKSYGSGPLPPKVRPPVLFPPVSASASAEAIREAVADVMRESRKASTKGSARLEARR